MKNRSPAKALHPVLSRWFESRFGDFTEIQRRALPHTLAHEHTLILAPTGSGKTLSAFLSVMSDLGRQAEAGTLPNATVAVYVSPLRSLDRDIYRNLTPILDALNAGLTEQQRIRMEIRTGDTEQGDRGKQARKRPHLLLTTPESLTSLLSQVGWREGFAPRTVIVDEIHAFAESKRGSLLSITLERLDARANGGLQRIGLSATAAPVDEITRLLCGDRTCAVASVDIRRTHKIDIVGPGENHWLPAAGYNSYRIAPIVAEQVMQGQCSIIFNSTRSQTERLALALRILLPDEEENIAIHHSSIDTGARFEVEHRLVEGTLRAVVCSTSLEMGVDFHAVDQVILVGAPRGVSRALQRIGRSGHRIHGVAQGIIVPLSLPDLLECIAIRRATEDARLDALKIPRAPLDVLAQGLLGMSIERSWYLDDAFDLIRRAGPYRTLTRGDFDSIVEYLAGGGRVLGPYGTYGKIFLQNGQFQVASNKIAREYYMNIGTISDNYQVRVVGPKNRHLGEVEEYFLGALQPGEAFVIGGRAVVLERLHQNTAMVRYAEGERVNTPRWSGHKLPISPELAAEELALRQDLRAAWEDGGAAAVKKILKKNWRLTPEITKLVAEFVERQYRATAVPVQSPVQVESIRQGRNRTFIFHVVAGRSINRSLSWVVGHRLRDCGSVVTNHDDITFLLSLNDRTAPGVDRLREAFNPERMREDLAEVVKSTELLGRSFRVVAEIGQLLRRQTLRGRTSPRAATWSGSLLYSTLLKYEPEHPLVREAVREVLEDLMDVDHASEEAARIYEAPWEVFELPRPSPFGLSLFAAFNRETLLAQDPDKALEELASSLYSAWQPTM